MISIEPYLEAAARLPQTGRHIIAQYDDEVVVVYQAYKPSIGHFAAAQGYFGGDDFSLNRMSWIKPNFLWMMYRCGWATKPDQEVVLAISLQRAAFDHLLESAVHSSYVPEVYGSEAAWKAAVARSDVRLQWDPDHSQTGAPLARRAIQLGLRGAALARYSREWIVRIEDITPFVDEQRACAHQYRQLCVPREEVYPASRFAARLGMESG